MRDNFNHQLEVLNEKLTNMGDLCENAIAAASDCLINSDLTLIEKVHATEQEIDHSEKEIEALCMRIILQQQPIASDLRTVSSALKMISDMERIGDQAADIADILEFIADSEVIGKVHIAEMAKATIGMVNDSVDSFVRKDMKLVQSVIKSDDTVDELFGRIKDELTAAICKNPDSAGVCLDILMIAKYLERIGDHAVNIAEWVEFSITGEHKEY